MNNHEYLAADVPEMSSWECHLWAEKHSTFVRLSLSIYKNGDIMSYFAGPWELHEVRYIKLSLECQEQRTVVQDSSPSLPMVLLSTDSVTHGQPPSGSRWSSWPLLESLHGSPALCHGVSVTHLTSSHHRGMLSSHFITRRRVCTVQ